MQIAIINGPNLNLLGKREPGVYGSTSFEEYFTGLQSMFPGVSFHYFQSNVEGELINELQAAARDHDGIILNPAGYTHTSVAIGDAIAAIKTPVVEVHISNIHARETFRHTSLITSKCAGMLTGFGLEGYAMAIKYFTEKG